MTRVLVVDDEPQIVRALVINLKARRYEVDAAPDGATALQLAAARHPDVVVLDLGLPDMDGVEVIKGLRGWTRVPILVLSARHTSDEKVEALDSRRRRLRHQAVRHGRAAGPAARGGAQGRTGRPGRGRRPRDRRDAGLHRGPGGEEGPTGGPGRAAHPHGVAPPGGPRPQQPWLVSQKQLLQEVWGPSYGTETNYLRVYMAQLRRKLEADPSHPRHFVTEPGMGYRFEKG